MSSISIYTKSGNIIQRTIAPNDDLCMVNNEYFGYNDSNYTDINITLDSPGTYHLSQQLLAKCNFSLIATVPGVTINAGVTGEEFNTTIGHDAFDESIIKVIEASDTPVKATIKNITFNFIGTHVIRHHEIWETPGSLAGYYFLKFQDLSQVTFENVSISLSSLKLTNIIFCGSSNVLIKDCIIKNYHEGFIGGNLWIRNSAKNPIIENIKIINNTFCKHGNDEAIAIWTLTAVNTGNAMRNILISGNRIEYAFPENESVNYTNRFQSNDVLVKIYGERTAVKFDNETGCPDKSSLPSDFEHIMENVIISDNIFHIKDLVHKVVSFWCDGYVKAQNIIAQNNTIIIDNIDFSGHDNYRTIGVFANNDILGADLEVTIANNTIISKCVFDNGQTPTVEALSIYGGYTKFKNNIVKTDGNGELIGVSIRDNLGITQSSENTDNSQTASINCRNFVKLDLDGNSFENLFLLGSFSYTSLGKYDMIFLNMTNNTLSGGTKIYCNNIATMHSVILNNTFKNKHEAYCFQNYAQTGTLRFCYNKIHPQSKYHRDYYLYKHYGTDVDLSHFSLITLIGNDYTNVNTATNYSGLPSDTIIEYDNTYNDLTQN